MSMNRMPETKLSTNGRVIPDWGGGTGYPNREEIAKPADIVDPIYDGDGKLVDPVTDLFTPRKLKRIDNIGRY